MQRPSGRARPERAGHALKSWAAVAALLALLLGVRFARAESEAASAAPAKDALAEPSAAPKSAAPVRLDRIVVRWHAPETGGVAKPQFIFERELAFEARIEALADRSAEASSEAYAQRHVRAALDRHIAETLLAHLPVDRHAVPVDIAKRAKSARAVLEQRVQGPARLLAAAQAEGMSAEELANLLERQARASLYVDRMVAPMLDPNDPELREVYRSGVTPYEGQPFEKIAPLLRRWYIGLKLSQALEAYYQTARSRVRVTILRRR